MILIFLVLQFVVSCSLQIGQYGTCFDKNGEVHCCADFEKRTETCVACKVGYRSDAGQSCTECYVGFYGYRCVERCNCSIGCHHILGCIEIQTTTENLILESTQSTETTTFSLSISTEDLTKDERTESAKTVDDETVASTGENRNGNTVFDWKMYVAVVATLVLILWIGTVFYKCRKKRRKKRDISQIVNQEENNPPLEPIEESVNEEHELGEYDEAEYPYNTIDESQMIDMSAERNVYLEVIDKSSSSGSTASCGKDSEGYLNPYSGLMTTMDGHTYDGNNEDIYNATEYDDATSTPILFVNRKEDANSDANSEFSEVESSGDSSSKIDGVDYLNPYTGIVASLDIHVYTRNIEKITISDRKSEKDDYYLRPIKFELNHTKVLSETNLQDIFTNESSAGKYCKSLSHLHQSS